MDPKNPKKPCSISAWEILLLKMLLDLAFSTTTGMVRLQGLELLVVGMFVELLCTMEFMSNRKLELPLASAKRRPPCVLVVDAPEYLRPPGQHVINMGGSS
jgi:hypothetical protein